MGKKQTPRATSSSPPATAERRPKAERDTTTPATPAREAEEVAALRASRAPLSPVQERAFARQQTDEACRTLGARTRGAGVFSEALTWARRLDAALARPDREGLAVTDAEAAWFYLWVERLYIALEAQRAGAGSAGARVAIAVARDASRAATAALLRRVRDAIGADPAWNHALDTALEPAPTGDHDVQRGRGLSELFARWFSRDEAEAAAVLSAEGLSEADGDRVRRLADALDASLRDRPATESSAFDAPAVNLAEGRVLYAMRKLRRKARAAREAGASSVVFRPGPATRSVLLNRAGGEADPGPDEDPEDPAPPVTPPAPPVTPPSPPVTPPSPPVTPPSPPVTPPAPATPRPRPKAPKRKPR